MSVGFVARAENVSVKPLSVWRRQRLPRLVAVLLTGLLEASTFAPGAEARTISFDERARAQRAIEQVYWNHRVWPKENPGPKPPLSAVMSDVAIRARVAGYLEQSNALATWWQRPIAAEQLQAEMERMAAQTRAPDTLRELFQALGDDPFLIAETLVRQTLADRLIRSWYANDARFHEDLKRKAEAALAACPHAQCMGSMGGDYRQTTWKLRKGRDEASVEGSHAHAVHLGADEWNEHLVRLAGTLGGAARSLPLLKLSSLEETAEGFLVTAVLSQSADEVSTAAVIWPKTPFEAWWADERSTTVSRVEAASGRYSLPAPTLTACANGPWVGIQEAPDKRHFHTAVWTGAEMIVWGGHGNAGSYLNTGMRYNPSTDAWTATSMGTNVPAGRHFHTAVWTGMKMIVWGGSYYKGAHHSLNTGGRYDPSADAWTTASTSASARSDHTVVWTGTEMIVWGGVYYDGSSSFTLNTGARYDPSEDAWTVTSTGDAPSARNQHTAVWTGEEMIVWGGWYWDGSSGTYFNTGGRYDPSTDQWRATSMGANVPYARSQHTAVWTGSEMIVWGSGYTGGRYNPGTDTWRATSTGANVPSLRSGHSAVWTGTEMIIWGGVTMNTGGRYDPSTDTWVTTSTSANVPSERSSHTALWTGVEMIVWGGSGNGARLSTGGLYCPCNGQFFYHDADFDGYGDPLTSVPSCDGAVPEYYVANNTDCFDLDSTVWAVPGEVGPVFLSRIGGIAVLHWSTPSAPGGYEPLYDTIRSTSQSAFTGIGAVCVESRDGSDLQSSDAAAASRAYYYLVRAGNICGTGTLGTTSSGGPRSGRSCP